LQSAIDERIKARIMIFIKIKYSHMSKDKPIKKYQYKSGESGNPTGRPKGSLNRKNSSKGISSFPSRRRESFDRH